MNNQIDYCPVCNNQGKIIYTNRISNRIHLLTIGNHGRYINRICDKCLSKIDDDFANGILPKLQGTGFEVLAFGLPIHFYEIYEQYPKLKGHLHKSLRFINNIYKGFVKVPHDTKHIYDFAALINTLEEVNLRAQKKEILKLLRVNDPCLVNDIHVKSEEMVNWSAKMNFPLTTCY